ncbi:hypothetical protein ANCCEY_10666 [Ancylostoma ceylanicum]|uniref:Riboflavin transporter n=1 Tax=Ancylostoma ceylanicum TaxID=53326 RepID=A0A0D6LJU0_9BILA|nr:hypothetical protein ANCCEY_10666 [Ancylostoma ceylanicum]
MDAATIAHLGAPRRLEFTQLPLRSRAGMGFSSLIPSILAIIQGTSTYKCEGGVPHYSQPLFSTAVFFGIIFVSNCISAVAFILLYRLADKKEPTEEPPESDGETRHNTAEVSSSTERMLSPSPEPLPKSYFALVLFTVTLINAQMNGIIPSISSYAALPYSQITASLLAAGLHSYLRVSFASRLRDCDNSESRLLWCGLFTQIGSFIGSMIMLPLVDIAHVFESAPPCQ